MSFEIIIKFTKAVFFVMNIKKRWDSHIWPWAHKQQTLQESPPPLSHDDLHVKRSTSSPDIRPKNIVFHMVSFDFFSLIICVSLGMAGI